MVEVELSRIIITETSEHQIIVLKEKDGTRSFPIVIGIYEATAIDRGVKEIRTPRPLTHDLLLNVVKSLKARVEKIVITSLRSSTFYAKLVLSRDGETVEVDSRPSDAIAIAVQDNTPIFVEDKVLSQAAPSDDAE